MYNVYIKYKLFTFFSVSFLLIKRSGVIILNRSNNSQISIEKSAPQQAGGFIIKCYFGISNITACR